MTNEFELSVVTVTYNAADHLPELIESLKRQADSDFEWVVADLGSRDNTVNLLKEAAKDLEVQILKLPECGYIDGLNQAIRAANGKFYVVASEENVLYDNAVGSYKMALDNSCDVISAVVKKEGQLIVAGDSSACLGGLHQYVSNHELGSAYRKSLHERFGFYSRRLPLAAEHLFVLSIAKKARFKLINAVVGECNVKQEKDDDLLGNATEFYRAQLEAGRGKFAQTLLLFARVLINVWKA